MKYRIKWGLGWDLRNDDNLVRRGKGVGSGGEKIIVGWKRMVEF